MKTPAVFYSTNSINVFTLSLELVIVFCIKRIENAHVCFGGLPESSTRIGSFTWFNTKLTKSNSLLKRSLTSSGLDGAIVGCIYEQKQFTENSARSWSDGSVQYLFYFKKIKRRTHFSTIYYHQYCRTLSPLSATLTGNCLVFRCPTGFLNCGHRYRNMRYKYGLDHNLKSFTPSWIVRKEFVNILGSWPHDYNTVPWLQSRE